LVGRSSTIPEEVSAEEFCVGVCPPPSLDPEEESVPPPPLLPPSALPVEDWVGVPALLTVDPPGLLSESLPDPWVDVAAAAVGVTGAGVLDWWVAGVKPLNKVRFSSGSRWGRLHLVVAGAGLPPRQRFRRQIEVRSISLCHENHRRFRMRFPRAPLGIGLPCLGK
jgi:hypothetical protein